MVFNKCHSMLLNEITMILCVSTLHSSQLYRVMKHYSVFLDHRVCLGCFAAFQIVVLHSHTFAKKIVFKYFSFMFGMFSDVFEKN